MPDYHAEAEALVAAWRKITPHGDRGEKPDLVMLITAALARAVEQAVARVRELETALAAVEFDCREKCVACAGWNVGPNGETHRAHTKTCIVAKALRRRGGTEGSPDSHGKEQV